MLRTRWKEEGECVCVAQPHTTHMLKEADNEAISLEICPVLNIKHFKQKTAAMLGYRGAGAIASLLYQLLHFPPCYSAQQISKTQFRPGWEGEGGGDVTDGPNLLQKTRAVAHPLCIAGSPHGSWWLMSYVQGPPAPDMRNGLCIQQQ